MLLFESIRNLYNGVGLGGIFEDLRHRVKLG